jgi:hypothetical protein
MSRRPKRRDYLDAAIVASWRRHEEGEPDIRSGRHGERRYRRSRHSGAKLARHGRIRGRFFHPATGRAAAGSGVLVYDVTNRGRKVILGRLDEAGADADTNNPRSVQDVGLAFHRLAIFQRRRQPRRHAVNWRVGRPNPNPTRRGRNRAGAWSGASATSSILVPARQEMATSCG